MRAWWLLFLILPGLLLAQLSVEVRDAWVREAPPGATVSAGYLVMKNTSEQAQRLQHISSKQFRTVELHQTLMEGEIAKMREVQDLEIPAGGEITFGPGGYHLMLMEPKDRPVAGSQVEITLRFASGLEIPVIMLVKKEGDADGHHHHHH